MWLMGKLIYLVLLINCVVNKSDGLNETILLKDILRIRENIPFQIPLITLEEPVTDTDIIYYIFNPQHKNVTIGKFFGYINRKYSIKMLVHGWTEHNYVEWYRNTISAYVKKGAYNIISVDWSSKGDTDYLTASRNARGVGNKIADFLIRLHDKRGVPYKNIHLISHSLGCHVAGFIGKRVFEITKRKLARITGLDPAAPIFDLLTMGPNNRLGKDDAHFVDIIHTDGGMLGFNFPIGTVDFFPNGGSAVQPGCSLIKADIKYEDLFCSHASSHQLFINSINGRKFIARPCESWEKFTKGLCNDRQSVVLGEDVPQIISGNYYLETKDSDIILK